MKRIGILTSGGDSPGMNAAIRAISRYAIYHGLKVMGIEEGYKGLMEGNIIDISISTVGGIIDRGGTVLKSARSEEFKTEAGLEKALKILRIFDIDGLVVIGGDGSLKGARELNKRGFPVVGVPATIDNDMKYTDHTIGFDTVLNTIEDAVSKIRDTTESHGRISIVEVMGRNSGQIALRSGIAGGADCILVPEIKPDIKDMCKKLIKAKNRGKKHSIIIFAEGVRGLTPYTLGEQITEVTGIETRITILGHLQRGGSPSAFDRIIASRFGAEAAKILIQGESNKAVGIKGNKIINVELDKNIELGNEIDLELLELGDILSI